MKANGKINGWLSFHKAASNPRRIALMVFMAAAMSAAAQTPQLVSSPGNSLASSAGGGDSSSPLISADGQFVLFASLANNLAFATNGSAVAAPVPQHLNVFLRNRNTGATTLISANSAGVPGNSNSWPRAISANARYVLFESFASDLVPADTNKTSDVFIRDLTLGTTTLVSVSTNGGVGSGRSQDSVMTPDGRYVAFSSIASNLVPGDTNQIPDVFVRDLQTGTTMLISPGAVAGATIPAGTEPPGSELPDITPDGRYVAFYSAGINLVPGVTSIGEIYVRDLVAQTTTMASTNARSIASTVFGTTDVISCNHLISTNGQFVAFDVTPNPSNNILAGVVLRYNIQTATIDVINTNGVGLSLGYTEARNLDMTPNGRFVGYLGISNGSTAAFVWDAQSGISTLASGTVSNLIPAQSTCLSPLLSTNGRFAVFLSNGTNLVGSALPAGYHLYRRDLTNGTTEPLDTDLSTISLALNFGSLPVMSSDASRIAFVMTGASTLLQMSGRQDNVFLRDLQISSTQLISVHQNGLSSKTAEGNNLVSSFSVSSNGQFVAFSSDADNVVTQDTNGLRDIFVRDLVNGVNILVSVGSDGRPAAGNSTDPSISADGRSVVFSSTATNLVNGVNTNATQIYLRDLAVGSNTLISVSTNGGSPADSPCRAPIISSDGRFVHFVSTSQNLAPVNSASNNTNLFTRDLLLGTTYAITTNGIGNFVPSANGRFIIYRDLFGGLGLKIWDPLTAATTVYSTSNNPGQFAVSDNGTRVAYTIFNQLRMGDVGTNDEVLVASGPLISQSQAGLRFSDDGRYFSYAANAGTSFTNVYLYDFQTGSNTLVSRSFNSSGSPNGVSDTPEISPDGRFVAYRSAASNLVPADNNSQPDLYLYDRLSGGTTLLSVNQSGSQTGNGRTRGAAFSGDSQTLAFQSWGSDIADRDYNNRGDVFAFKLWGSGSSNSPPPFGGTIVIVNIPIGGNPNAPVPSISWPVTPGVDYHVQYKNHLEDPFWLELDRIFTVVGGQAYVLDLAPDQVQRFYRISTQ
jgi:dipeptidyl aminopeptidase/acylaminoacyl peptidase